MLLLFAACAATAATPPWMNQSLSVNERVALLLPQLSLAELSVQLIAPDGLPPQSIIAQFANTSIGTSTMQGPAAQDEVQRFMLNSSRWGIPVAWQHESLHSGCFGGTIFPMPLTMGSTWNTSLVQAIYDAVGTETLKCGAGIAFAPVINLFTDPRFGRFQEGFSPDPTLTAHMAVAAVAGLQGETTGNASTYLMKGRVVSLAKHYVAYGAAVGGLNAAPAQMNERILRDVYLKPWRAFAKAGGRGAMPSHQSVLDVPMHANGYAINTILREELGFGSAITLSDCNDANVLQQFRVSRNVSESAALAIKGGLDQDLQCGQVTYSIENIQAAVTAGLLDETDVRKSAGRVLAMKFATGLFDNPFTSPPAGLDPPAFRALAREASEQGTVLLLNEARLLPLPPRPANDWSDVALVGWLASQEAADSYVGSYSSLGAAIVTVQQAFAGARYSFGASPNASSSAAEIQAGLAVMQASKYSIVVLGDSGTTCGEWMDRASLDLPGGQMDLLAAIFDPASGVNPASVIVVLLTGRPATFGTPELFGRIQNLVWVGRPGEEAGNALKNVLTGAVNPSGRLNAPWPKTVGHVGSGATPFQQDVVGKWVANALSPQDPDGRCYDSYVDDPWGVARPLFPFGYGLSYTNFTVANATAVFTTESAASPLTVSFTVSNTGGVDGTAVVQVYVVTPAGGLVVRPWKRLASFARTPVAKGASVVESVTVGYDDLALTAEQDLTQRAIASGVWTVRVGLSSVTDTLTATFTVP
ncbi:Periplasmic beta-glucosidase [Diplonema papillatum]|nr:Periplasmic beta-glucosidase [Diplonema papillatum]